MTTDAIYEERGSDWSQQVSVVATTRWLQRDQTLPLSAKGVACETRSYRGDGSQMAKCIRSMESCPLTWPLLPWRKMGFIQILYDANVLCK